MHLTKWFQRKHMEIFPIYLYLFRNSPAYCLGYPALRCLMPTETS